MRSLSDQEARSWCQRRQVNPTDDDYLYYKAHERRCIAIDLPEKPYRLVALANALLPYWESVPFQGALLWVRQCGVWGEHTERAGLRVMEVMRAIHGDTRPLEDAPGYLFDESELIDLQVCFIQPLLIGWDAFLIPESGEYFVATSHDETTCLIGRTKEIHVKLFAELQPWKAREDPNRYFKRIGIPAEGS